MIALLSLQGCLFSLSAGEWSPTAPVVPQPATGETGALPTQPSTTIEPPTFSLEGDAIAVWIGPNVGSRFGKSLDLYGGGQYVAVWAEQLPSQPGEIFLFDVPTDTALGDLAQAKAQMRGDPQFCSGGSRLIALASGGTLDALLLSCPTLGAISEGGVYILPADELIGEVSFGDLTGAVLWLGDLSGQCFGCAIGAGDLFEPKDGAEDVVVGAPSGLGAGSVYVLPSHGSGEFAPGTYRVGEEEERIFEITGVSAGGYLGKALDVGVGVSGDPLLAVSAPGDLSVFSVEQTFQPGGTMSIGDAKLAFLLGNGDGLASDLHLLDLDGDGKEDLVIRGSSRWYGLPLDPAPATTTGACSGALWCIASGESGYAVVGEFDGQPGPDLALSSAPSNRGGQISLFFGAGALSGPIEQADADLVLEGLGESTGVSMGSVPHLDYDWLMVGEPGFNLGLEDIGGVFLVDVQRLL